MSVATENKPEFAEKDPAELQSAFHAEDEEEMVTFLDRCIAFVLLLVPWGYLIVWVQGLLLDKVNTTVVNMAVLAGMIGFLVVVDKVSKRIYRLRAARWK
ncbi:MAG: hypothetical protein FJY85_05405 [Deltaproteobacteria bacterium]|nr:hypothetical protein [Deltaproteobacteria bacterium]